MRATEVVMARRGAVEKSRQSNPFFRLVFFSVLCDVSGQWQRAPRVVGLLQTLGMEHGRPDRVKLRRSLARRGMTSVSWRPLRSDSGALSRREGSRRARRERKIKKKQNQDMFVDRELASCYTDKKSEANQRMLYMYVTTHSHFIPLRQVHPIKPPCSHGSPWCCSTAPARPRPAPCRCPTP